MADKLEAAAGVSVETDKGHCATTSSGLVDNIFKWLQPHDFT